MSSNSLENKFLSVCLKKYNGNAVLSKLQYKKTINNKKYYYYSPDNIYLLLTGQGFEPVTTNIQELQL